MTPKHRVDRHDTRPQTAVPDTARPDTETLDRHDTRPQTAVPETARPDTEAPDRQDTRPQTRIPDTTPSDTETLGPRSRIPAPGDPGPAANAAAETGFVGGFRTEPEAADESHRDDSHPDESPEDILGRPPTARDVAAELTAPPRRRLPALTLTLGAGVFLAVGFLAGVEVQKDQGEGTNQAAGPAAAQGANPYGARAAGAPSTGGGGQGTGRTGGGAAAGPGAGAGSDLTTGTVKIVDDSFIYVSDSAGNIVKVKTDAATKIQVVRDGKPVDLKPGDAVVVRGATDADGSVAATSVTEGTATAARPGAGNPGTSAGGANGTAGPSGSAGTSATAGGTSGAGSTAGGTG
ncbi:hypothetical protein ACIRL2_04115 [Embleya sp. NPDC127516]|uniref:hypothetical protein n=1 Tax=Embleya sp. NPDC127516 TaxID=3363990 RepID=UPI0037FCEF06